MTTEDSRICEFCEKRPGVEEYTNARAKFSIIVCASCRDRLAVQDGLGELALQIDHLQKQRKHEEALALLDEFFDANRHRDHDGWLARSVASHREFILWDAGRYAEALEACEAVAQFGFENVWDRWALGSAKAKNLQALGRHEEALAAFEEAFSHQDPRYASAAAHFLPVLAELYENLGRPVDEKCARSR